MGESEGTGGLRNGLTGVLARAGLPAPGDLVRLTGGATMESWRFKARGAAFVLRRAPSHAFIEGRPFGHDTEAAIIRAARAAGVAAPEVVTELEPEDAIGSGFIMRALPGTPDPHAILAMEEPDRLLAECASQLALIHSLKPGDVPQQVPVMNYRAAIAELKRQFEEAGGDRPIIALGLLWLEDNCPDPVDPVLNHGDFRLGNLLVQDGRLTGVLDWELAHFGDWHEDLAFGCMAVWRFARYDRPALGLGDLETYFNAYEASGGRKIDPARFRYWLIHRTVWWALGCLRNARMWREGQDRMLERVVISRRTSEQELDLLMLLEEDAPEGERERRIKDFCEIGIGEEFGEAESPEILVAVLECLETLKDKMEGHDRFQLAVVRNALGIVIRENINGYQDWYYDERAVERVKNGDSLSYPGYLENLRYKVLHKVTVDSPKYPALAVARKKWTGQD